MKRNLFLSDQILDFSADLNPLGPPASLPTLLEEASKQVTWYPDPSYQDFREAVGNQEGVDAASILVGNGTADLIHLISHWQARRRAAVVVPTFTEYERAILADGSHLVRWPLSFEDRFSPPAFNGAPGCGPVNLLFLCNPNNPTGTLWPKGCLQSLMEICERVETFLVVDEATMDLVEDPVRYSVVGWVKRCERLIVLRSMTKAFAVPGLRIGYLVASARIVEKLSAFQPPWAMNALAADVGKQLLREQRYLADSRARLKEFRETFWKGLTEIRGIRPYPSVANFFLCRIEDHGWSNRQLAEKLGARGILIRICDDFTGLPAGRFFRVAIRTHEENGRFLNALREILANAG